MGTDTMGRVTVAAKIENLWDLREVEVGTRTVDDVRSVDVEDALVDTGATALSLPGSIIERLGLAEVKRRQVRTAAGLREVVIYGPVRLTIQGRDCLSDVAEVPESCPALIGQVPLELMDWVVDLRNRRLIGNPEHGGEWMYDLF